MPAREVVTLLREHGLTIACAESLTGGALVSALVDVPGASAVVRGGVVAYATDLKASLLGVDAALLAAHGPVDPDAARQMADGVRTRLGADVGLATTGVAGPATQHDQPVGTVYIAAATAYRTVVRPLRLVGTRDALRAATVLAALALVRGGVLEPGNNSGMAGV